MSKRPVPIFLILSTIVFVAVVACNVFLPLLQGRSSGVCIGNLIILGCWTYTLLGSFGIIKHIAVQDEDGNIEYDTTVPVIQVVILRLIELGYFMLFKRINFEYKHFIVLVVLDVVYVVLTYVYKGSYYYESRAEEDE